MSTKPATELALSEVVRKMALRDWWMRLTSEQADALRDNFPQLVEDKRRLMEALREFAGSFPYGRLAESALELLAELETR